MNRNEEINVYVEERKLKWMDGWMDNLMDEETMTSKRGPIVHTIVEIPADPGIPSRTIKEVVWVKERLWTILDRRYNWSSPVVKDCEVGAELLGTASQIGYGHVASSFKEIGHINCTLYRR